jgi:hypothetical protein
MSEHPGVSVPHVDDSMRPEQIAQRAERIAVPSFDWVGQPIDAMVEGVTGHGRRAESRSGEAAAGVARTQTS